MYSLEEEMVEMKPIPSPIMVTTGDQDKVQETIDSFFLETARYLKQNNLIGCEIKSGEIAYNPRQVTDDRITYLLYQDQVVAGVLETRTEFNHVCYTFFRNLEGLEKKSGFNSQKPKN